MARRTLVMTRPADPENPAAGTDSLGSYRDLLQAVAPFNTAPDAGVPSTGTHVLHGPGFIIEVSASVDEINQAMVNVSDMDCAPTVLTRMCRANGWRLQDVETGMTFG